MIPLPPGMGQASNKTEEKWGVFQEWTEDEETVDITLPLPPGTTKKDVQCKITADTLVVTSGEKLLLRAIPLGGPVDPMESTWTLQGDMLNLQLSKQWRGKTRSDQIWGHYLSKEGGDFACYMSPDMVKELKAEKARKEKEIEAERRERVRASEKALRERGPSEPKVAKRIINPSGATVPNRPSPRDAAKAMIKEMHEKETGASGSANYFILQLAQKVKEDKSMQFTLFTTAAAILFSFVPVKYGGFGFPFNLFPAKETDVP